MYGDPHIGKVKSVIGKFHKYPPINLDYTKKGEVKIYMRNYVENMIDEFPINIERSQAVASPSTKNIFKVDRSNTLNKSKVGLFHTTVARYLFLFKRARQDIHPTIAILCTTVTAKESM